MDSQECEETLENDPFFTLYAGSGLMKARS